MSTTDCHRYLSAFAGLTADTIDLLVRNGIDSLNTLRGIDMDKDWHQLPPQISIGQKVLLRQALTKLADNTDGGDNGGDKTKTTSRQNVTDIRVVINFNGQIDDRVFDNVSDNNGKEPLDNDIDLEDSSGNQFYQITDDNDLTVSSYDNDFDLKKLLSQTQPLIMLSPLKIPKKINESNTRRNSRLKLIETQTDCIKCGHQCDHYLSPTKTLDIHVNDPKNCQSFKFNELELKRLALQTQPVVVVSPLKMPTNRSKTVDSSNSRLNLSKVKTNGKNRLKCGQCDHFFRSELRLGTHINRYHNNCKKPFKCDKCDKEFVANESLLNHLGLNHGIRSFPCDKCQYNGWTKWHLIRHKNTKHSNYRPFVCKYNNCDKSFKQIEVLDAHQKLVHSSDRPFVCNYNDCSKSFKLKKNLVQHNKLVHLSKGLFVCNYDDCNKLYTSKHNMLLHHKRIHEKPKLRKFKSSSKKFKLIDEEFISRAQPVIVLSPLKMPIKDRTPISPIVTINKTIKLTNNKWLTIIKNRMAKNMKKNKKWTQFYVKSYYKGLIRSTRKSRSIAKRFT